MSEQELTPEQHLDEDELEYVVSHLRPLADVYGWIGIQEGLKELIRRYYEADE